MLNRCLTLGVQLFVPMAIVGCAICAPLPWLAASTLHPRARHVSLCLGSERSLPYILSWDVQTHYWRANSTPGYTHASCLLHVH